MAIRPSLDVCSSAERTFRTLLNKRSAANPCERGRGSSIGRTDRVARSGACSRTAAGERAESEWQGVKLGELDPGEIEALLGDTVLAEFKKRLERIGLEYQSPERP